MFIPDSLKRSDKWPGILKFRQSIDIEDDA